MSDMKCVKCNSDLERIGDFYTCTNPHCTLCGDKDMWQELIRTRKALDIAVDALNAVTATPLNSRVIHDVANDALKQITALEQKD